MTEASPEFTDGIHLAWQKVSTWGTDFYLLLPNIMAGMLILVLFLAFSYAFKRLIDAYFARQNRVDLGRLLSDVVFWFMALLGGMIALTIIMPSVKPVNLISGLGLGSLAIGFAFKDILQNWLAGLLILLRLPFRRGDQIKVGIIEGTVERIEPRATIIRTYDGKDIVVPNTIVYTNEVIIQTSQPRRRVEIALTVGYDHEVNFIQDIIYEALAPIEEIMDEPEPQVLCWNLGATSLDLKIRWWINSERSQEVISRARAVQAIKETFQANDVDPTDPDLVYMMQAHSPDDPDGDGKPAAAPAEGKKARRIVKKVPPPPKFEMGENDPETYTHKQDDKNATLLPADEL